MELIKKTEQLLSVCEQCLNRHARMREEDRDPDFFTEVKPFADEHFAILDSWKEEMESFIREKRPKYVHQQQIDSLDEMMKQFIVQSFYQKTGKKRFVQSIQSARYTLKTILDELRKEGGLQ